MTQHWLWTALRRLAAGATVGGERADGARGVRKVPRSVWSAGASLLLHGALVAAALLLGPTTTSVSLKRGEPLFIELPNVREPAPRGNPAGRSTARPSQIPAARQAPRPSALPAPEIPAAPARIASAPRAEPVPPAPVTRERTAPAVAPEPRAPLPATVSAPPAAEVKASPLPRAEPRAPASEPQLVERPQLAALPPPPPEPKRGAAPTTPEAPVPGTSKEPPSVVSAPEAAVDSAPPPPAASAPPPPTPAPAAPDAPSREASTVAPSAGADWRAWAEPDGGGDRLAALRPQSLAGGLRDGRGGIEGEPVPLNTRDPRYNDYFERLRRMIKDKWVYPREAAERNIGGQLMLAFGIAKDGQLRFIELRRSSGVAVLDDYAMNAVRLAQPFPPIPDAMSRAGIPVLAVFNYVIERDAGMLTNILR